MMSTRPRMTGWIAIVSALCGVVAATVVGAPAVAATSSTASAALASPGVDWQPQRMSVMVQVSSVAQQTNGPANLAAVLHEIRAHHRTPGAPGYIQNLVVQDIAPAAGDGSHLYTSVLDVLAPYLPGGARASFDNVFIGTLLEPPAPQGAPATWSPYVDGITDPTLTAAHVAASKRAATAFAARYPRISFNWYISWEAFLPGMMYSDSFAYPAPPKIKPSVIRSAFLDYQTRLIQALSAIRPGRAFLWSPALDRSWAQVAVDGQATIVQQNLQSYFGTLHSRAAVWLEPQDGLSRPCRLVGGASGNTIADRVDWFHRLAAMNLPVAALHVNAELNPSPYCPGTSSADQVRARLFAYEQGGVPIGSSFDIFSWYRSVARGPLVAFPL